MALKGSGVLFGFINGHGQWNWNWDYSTDSYRHKILDINLGILKEGKFYQVF